MTTIFAWVKRNWLSFCLVLAVLFLLGKDNMVSYKSGISSDLGMAESVAYPTTSTKQLSLARNSGIYPQSPPVAQDQRMIVQDTFLSMQVKDVSEVVIQIEQSVVTLGGYMVNRNVYTPEGAATGNITVRVPTEKRGEALTSIKSLGIKTVSENVTGSDVTDQYVDIQGRIDNLNKTKAKIEVLMEKAVRVQDLMDIQMQLDNIQSQIDSYLGQQKYLEQTAKMTRISVNLSTDELALPYSPDSAWRPEVVFKTAVRAMLVSLRSIANSVIWLVVYIPIIAILVLVIWVIKTIWRKFQSRHLVS